jgi:hypothetical protein
MKKQIFRNDWHMLTGEQIVNLFDQNFYDVTIQPNQKIVYKLRSLEVATLELLENRSSSTVYRIRQTDEIYQIFQPNGDTLIFDTEDYFSSKPIDELLTAYSKKEPVFRGEKQSNGFVLIEHLKEPRFKAFFDGNEFKNILWIDEQPLDVSLLAKLMRKAGAFLKSYF